MKTKILSIDGKEKGTIELPQCFSETVREDIVAKVLESKKIKQPYSPSPVSGKQNSASGRIVHRRHVWKSGYGRGMSRVPRKAMSRRGSQFNWVGAEVSNTRGGRRPHPPKVLSMLSRLKINKKEMLLALKSALAATISDKWVTKRYSTLESKKLDNLPLVIESKFVTLKTKEIMSSLKEILGENLFKVAIKKKSVRSGRGKLRGRKYKSTAGLLVVVGAKEKLKINGVDVVNVKKLGVTDLAKGGVGRLTVYTEEAIREIGEKLK